MIILILFMSVAFGAIFSAPLDWQTKLFLGSALLLIDFKLSLLDFQADNNNEVQQELLITAFNAMERRMVSKDSPSIQSALEEMFRLKSLRDRAGSRDFFSFAVPFGSYVVSIACGALIASVAATLP